MRRLPLSLRLWRRRARQGPPARYDVVWEPALRVPGADGTTLLADHYAPVTDEPCPTILIRATYIRGGWPWNMVYGAAYAEQGFHVILQSSRATGGSDGEFHTWRNEAPDGQAAIEWLRKQDWFTGEFHTLGASYMTYSQLSLAADPPPEWRGAVCQVGLTHPHSFFWPGGAFALERSLVGGLNLFGNANMFRDNVRLLIRLQRHWKKAVFGLPLIEAYRTAMGGRRPEFEAWLTSPEPDDDYWRGADLTAAARTLPVPLSLSTGWHDFTTGQFIDLYRHRRDAGLPVDLLIGPWTHTGILDKGWAESYPWALRALRGREPATPVRVHVGGADEWRDLPDWPPPAEPRRFFLAADGLRAGPGPGASTFRYDPADPTPSIGGALQSKTQGTYDNAELEARSDVLLFSTEPLTGAVEVMGTVHAEFDATTTAASADLFARLCDVDPSGKSVNVCDGLTRFTGGRVVVDMGSTAHRFRPGHRIRLLVAGGAHPRWLRNHGTGEPVASAVRMVSTDTTVRHSSSVIVSVV
ncbi:CocE/NonD family hydrolase [Actinoplanes rectilineatus]|uniref:CocE/NonD family hydrolase n=1 Tax=Actinoplanes rectilineatus TaxID=113571 RepID=UPI0005F28190|nr:CocE/NonD family hydrolase [Actinoplanes rectilineatus]